MAMPKGQRAALALKNFKLQTLYYFIFFIGHHGTPQREALRSSGLGRAAPGRGLRGCQGQLNRTALPSCASRLHAFVIA